MLKVEYINPFVESVYELFSTMLATRVERGDLTLVQQVSQPRDITALIGLTGPTRGIVALTFPVTTALSIVSRLSGMGTRVVDETVLNTMAELVNIVAGGARSRLQEGEREEVHLSLPTVVRGVRYQVDYPTQTHWLDVPFTSDLGPFHLRVTFESDEAGVVS